MNNAPLENGLQIWMALVGSGLEESRKSRGNSLPGYDAELVLELRQRLYPGATCRLEQKLRTSPPSTEAFLEAFFRALKPFSEMLRDVLGMFEQAGARRSNENLRIAFDFDQASAPLALTLQEFREAESFLRHVVRPLVVRLWSSNTLWSLNKDVQDVLESVGIARTFGNSNRVRDPRVRRWVEENGKPDWLTFPGIPRSGNHDLDEVLRTAEDLIHLMISEILKLGGTYREFAQRLSDLPWEESQQNEVTVAQGDLGIKRPRRDFVGAAHDFWPNAFAESVSLAAEHVNDFKDDELALRLAAAMRTAFDRVPRHERTRISLEQDFRDVVNLPLWKKRHELYAVWVASRIAEALQDLAWKWHPDGDTLRFSFGGVELATLRSLDGGTHVFWTEKRTALKGGGILGRKHIQPDYRIMTVPTHRDDATSLVVECKQYRKWSKKNFGIALDDYAKGCPAAPIILVNYGPTDLGIIELVDPSRRNRTYLVGDLKPGGGAALNRFRELVRGAYASVLTPRIAGAVEIELRWGPLFRDLDLHLFIRSRPNGPTQHIGLGTTQGSLTESPWAAWHEDILESPPGVERMTIARWLDAQYDVLVHDYSGIPGFPQGDLSLRLHSTSGEKERVFNPPHETGRWWHVCRIDGISGEIDEISGVYWQYPRPEDDLRS
jgi:hypothetical protein